MPHPGTLLVALLTRSEAMVSRGGVLVLSNVLMQLIVAALVIVDLCGQAAHRLALQHVYALCTSKWRQHLQRQTQQVVVTVTWYSRL
jgi:hypothetical protein